MHLGPYDRLTKEELRTVAVLLDKGKCHAVSRIPQRRLYSVRETCQICNMSPASFWHRGQGIRTAQDRATDLRYQRERRAISLFAAESGVSHAPQTRTPPARCFCRRAPTGRRSRGARRSIAVRRIPGPTISQPTRQRGLFLDHLQTRTRPAADRNASTSSVGRRR